MSVSVARESRHCDAYNCGQMVVGTYCGKHAPRRKYAARTTPCKYPNCQSRARGEYCHNHKPEAFLRRKKWIASARAQAKKLYAEEVSRALAEQRAAASDMSNQSEASAIWRSEFDPDTSEVSGWQSAVGGSELSYSYDDGPGPATSIDEQHAPPMIDIDTLSRDDD